MLARVCRAIADGDGLIRDVNTEVRDIEQADRLAEIIGSLDEVRVIDHHDRAIERHVGGKIAVEPRIELNTLQDLRDVYTPGVARVCQAIAADPAQAIRYTWIGHTVAICTNGTRVLGLGDIGPLASMPVMEGKAVFYRQLAGISAMPILID